MTREQLLALMRSGSLNATPSQSAQRPVASSVPALKHEVPVQSLASGLGLTKEEVLRRIELVDDDAEVVTRDDGDYITSTNDPEILIRTVVSIVEFASKRGVVVAEACERAKAVFRNQSWDDHTLLRPRTVSHLDTFWGDLVALNSLA
jgi:hypothetical protein